MNRRVLIVGATSPIGRAMALEFLERGDHVYLSSRDKEEVERIAKDLSVRTSKRVEAGVLDLTDFEAHGPFLKDVVARLSGLDGVVIVSGSMDGLEEAFEDPGALRRLIDTNFTGPAAFLTLVATYLEGQGRGFIAAVGSVAGDRGRALNYPYGAAKGGLALFLQGLRNRLFRKGIQVTTIKPGFVDTRMTFGREKLLFLASPGRVAKLSVRAIEKGRDVAYVPPIWRLVMWVIRLIPERIFKKMTV